MEKLVKTPVYVMLLITAVIGGFIALFLEVMLLVQIPWIRGQQGNAAGGPIELLLLVLFLVTVPQFLIISIVNKKIPSSVKVSISEKVILSMIASLILYFIFNAISNSWIGR